MPVERDFDKEIDTIKKRINLFKTLAWLSVSFGFITLIVGFDLYYVRHEKFNEVGDFIGGFSGSLWALAGLFFIYIAFLGQKIEIKYQQEDLELTRDELKETKEVFKQQAAIMNNQQLDNTFFNLLENHRSIVSSFGERENKIGSNELITGDEILLQKSNKWKKIFFNYSKLLKTRLITDNDNLATIPFDLNSLREPKIDLLYNEVLDIIYFIDNKIDKKSRKFYFSILSNNLNDYVKWLIEAYEFIQADGEKIKFRFNQFSNSIYVSNLKLIVDKVELTHTNKSFVLDSKREILYSLIRANINSTFKRYLIVHIAPNDIKLLKSEKINYDSTIDLFEDFQLEFLFKKIKTIEDYYLKPKKIFLVIEYNDFNYIFNYNVDLVEIKSSIQININYQPSLSNEEMKIVKDYFNEFLNL